MDAIVIAGGIPKKSDPLYAYSQGKPKAMIDIKGQPMILWVLQALANAKQVDDCIVVGLDDPADQKIVQNRLNQPITFLPNAGGLVQNGLAGLAFVYQKFGRHVPVIGCSSDIPHMQGFMVDDLIARCQPLDRILYYAAVTPETMAQSYPNSQRTFANLNGEKLAGADIFVSTTRIYFTNKTLWLKVINARKKPLAMAWTIGITPFVKLALGRFSVDDAAALAGNLLEDGQPIGVIHTPYAQLAMDGDKPHQIDILRKT